MMTFDEALQVWARKQFELYQYSAWEDDTFDIESTVIYAGGCETCSYEIAGYRIMNYRTHKLLEVEVQFGQLMQDLQAIADGS